MLPSNNLKEILMKVLRALSLSYLSTCTTIARAAVAATFFVLAFNAEAQTLPVRAEAKLLLRIPAIATDGSINFSYPTAAVQLNSGVIAVSDAREFTVTFFSPDGKRAAQVGRQGDGPGEFRSNNSIGECATDSVFVFDRMQRRFSVFSPQGKFVRSGNLPLDPVSVSCTRTGFIVAPAVPKLSPRAPIGGGERVVYSGTIAVLNTRGDIVTKLENMQIGEMRPLGKLTKAAVSGSKIAIGTGDSAYVELRNVSGIREGGFRAGTANRRTTKTHIDAALDALVADFPSEAQRRAARRMVEQQEVSDVLPPYSAIFHADTSGFWVVGSIPGDAEITLTRYSIKGTAEVTVTLPKELRVLYATKNKVLAAAPTSDEDEELRVYDVSR